MWAKQIILCLCAATLTVAIPIKTKKLIIENASDFSATKFSENTDLADNSDNIPTLQDEKEMMYWIKDPAVLDKMEVLGNDKKFKTRIRRGIFRVKCPAGETKIGGICMTCQEMGTC